MKVGQSRSLGTVFRGNTLITKFNEFVYFTRVTRLDNWAFNSASNLEEITFPNSFTTLGNNSLRNTKLHNITLPSSMQSIGEYSIYGFGYSTLTVLATTPPTIDFTKNNAPSGNIYVPADYVDTYKAASGWSSYASRVKGISERPTQ